MKKGANSGIKTYIRGLEVFIIAIMCFIGLCGCQNNTSEKEEKKSNKKPTEQVSDEEIHDSENDNESKEDKTDNQNEDVKKVGLIEALDKLSGVIDTIGDEIYDMPKKQVEELDLSESERPEVLKVTLTVKAGGRINLRNKYNSDIISSGVVGLFGCPVEVGFESVGEPAQLSFEVSKDDMKNVPIENLIVLYYNEDDSFYDTVESTREGYVITAEIEKEGTYMLADMYQWYSAWGIDMSEYAHESYFREDEFGFEFLIPKGISVSKVISIWQESNGMMERELIFQNSKSSTDMEISLKAMKFAGKEDNIRNPQPQIPLEEMVSKMWNVMNESWDSLLDDFDFVLSPLENFSLDNGCGAYIIMYFIKDKYEQSGYYYVSGYIEHGENSYIVLSYTVKDEDRVQDAVNSIKSFKYIID